MYNTSYNENIHSYVNNINTIEGGTHLAGFRRALTRTLDVYKRQGEKYDAKPTYKKFSGYRPGVAVIGDLIVGIENSDGNTKVCLLYTSRCV